MRKRTKARQFALQILYQVDIANSSVKSALEDFWAREPDAAEEVKNFVSLIVEGTIKHLRYIDQLISKYSIDWDISRMPVVDRNILRAAVYELLYIVDVSVNVTINEALELAKAFSSEESVKFINAVLDQAKHHQNEVKLDDLVSSTSRN